MSEGKKKDRESYFLCLAEIGGYLDIILNMFEDTTISTQILIKNTKIIMTTVSTTRSLPESHRLKKSLQWKLGFTNTVIRKREVIKSRQLSVKSDDNGGVNVVLWPSLSSSSQMMNKVDDPFPFINSKSMLGMPSTSSSVVAAIGTLGTGKKGGIVVDIPSPIEQISSHLTEILADVLKVDALTAMTDEVKHEISDVFSSWRRPHLLLGMYVYIRLYTMCIYIE